MGCKCFVTGITIKEASDCINRGEYQKAIKLLLGNETENEGEALYLLGLAYDGLQDLKSAFTYYKKAADLDYPNACYNLAFAYAHGRGVTTDMKLAIRYYQKAARLLPDDVNVISALANAYVYVSNYDKAAEAMKRAISLGNDEALFTLGVIYFKLERDDEAVKYLKMALDKGEKRAQRYLDIIASENS